MRKNDGLKLAATFLGRNHYMAKQGDHSVKRLSDMVNAMDDGQWTMDDGRWTMDDGRWTMDDGRWTMDDGRWGTAKTQRPQSQLNSSL
jgi:hypothetical protein